MPGNDEKIPGLGDLFGMGLMKPVPGPSGAFGDVIQPMGQMGAMPATRDTLVKIMQKGIVGYHGSRYGDIEGGFRPEPHDEAGLPGVSFSRDRGLAEQYANDVFNRARPGETVKPRVYKAQIDTDEPMPIMEFYDMVRAGLGKEVYDLSDDEIIQFAAKQGVRALDTSAIGERGEVFVLDPTAIKVVE